MSIQRVSTYNEHTMVEIVVSIYEGYISYEHVCETTMGTPIKVFGVLSARDRHENIARRNSNNGQWTQRSIISRKTFGGDKQIHRHIANLTQSGCVEKQVPVVQHLDTTE